MEIIFFCKKSYMGKDVIDDTYGRLFNVPNELNKFGFQVAVYCQKYSLVKRDSDKQMVVDSGVNWMSYSTLTLVCELLKFRLFSFFAFGKKPMAIVGSSDCLQIIIASVFARNLGVPLLVDLYDNYESFGMARIPFMKFFFRRALCQASAITCVSAPLAKLIRTQLAERDIRSTRIEVLESTINPSMFVHRGKAESRTKLGFLQDEVLIGYAGALDSSRDIEVLYEAFYRLTKRRANVRLVLAGLSDGSCEIPVDSNITYIGQISHDDVVSFYSCLDVGVICLKDSEFGRYSFPQKAYEMIAIGIPLVVTAVGAMKSLFSGHPEVLYEPGDVGSLLNALMSQIDSPKMIDIPIPSWNDQAKILKNLLLEVSC